VGGGGRYLVARCRQCVRTTGLFTMGTVALAMAFGMAVLVEHFSLFPGLLFATEGGA